MLHGEITEIRYDSGYGFLKEAKSGKLIRFSIGLNDHHLQKNDRIEFTVIDLDPGKLAFIIRKLSV